MRSEGDRGADIRHCGVSYDDSRDQEVGQGGIVEMRWADGLHGA